MILLQQTTGNGDWLNEILKGGGLLAIVTIILKVVFDFIKSRNGSAAPTQETQMKGFELMANALRSSEEHQQSRHEKQISILQDHTEILTNIKNSSNVNMQMIKALQSLQERDAIILTELTKSLITITERQTSKSATIDTMNSKLDIINEKINNK